MSFIPAEALTKAMRVFWTQGYDATSMADLMAATGLHKGSIYRQFGDKHAFFKASLAHYIEVGMEGLRVAVEQASSPREAVNEFMKMSLRQCVTGDRPSGCFMMNSAVELGPHDPEIESMVAGVMEHVRSELTRLLAAGQKLGEFRADLKPRDMADLLMTVKAGVLTAGKVAVDGRDPFQTIETALVSLRPAS